MRLAALLIGSALVLSAPALANDYDHTTTKVIVHHANMNGMRHHVSVKIVKHKTLFHRGIKKDRDVDRDGDHDGD